MNVIIKRARGGFRFTAGLMFARTEFTAQSLPLFIQEEVTRSALSWVSDTEGQIVRSEFLPLIGVGVGGGNGNFIV